MADIKLPFSLVRPSPTEGVTDATEIDDKAIGKSLHEINEDLYSQAPNLITIDEFRAIRVKEYKYYYVAKTEADKAAMKTWRIYLRTQLIGEFNVTGFVTLPTFPMRFPFRFA